MPVKMEHPKHGRTHAYTSQEVEKLESTGWTVCPPKPVVEPVVELPEVVLQEVQQTIKQLQRPRRKVK